MAAELIPVVDLRLLSQAELNTLSLSSPNAFDVRRCDDVVVPKIDRSVFNESAGSRKQTYSRLRLATRKTDHPSSSSPPSAAAPADPDRRENRQIVSFLRQLFARDDPSFAASAAPQPEALALTLPNGVSAEEASKALVLVDDGDKEVLNANGVAIDLVGLGEMEDPFGDEFKRRTAGMRTDVEILGFLGGLDGQWVSRRKKRKFVDAAVFGDCLPRGWKLLLGLRRKEGIARLDCRRYVSPNGKQFVSCKDVSTYILSLVGHQDARQSSSSQNNGGTPSLDNVTPGTTAGPTTQGDTKMENGSYSVPPISSVSANCILVAPISSVSANREKQIVLHSAEQTMAEAKNVLECHKCSLTFIDKDALVQHLLSFHQSVKRRRLGKSIGDGVIVKDGKYECQFCHKTFSERHRYNGHIGAHVRYQGVNAESSLDGIIAEKRVDINPMDVVPLSRMDGLDNKNVETCTSRPVGGDHCGPNSRLSIDNHETDQNLEYHEPGTSVEAGTSRSVNHPVKNSDVVGVIAEIDETSNPTSFKCNDTTNSIRSSAIANNTAQDCPTSISQEAFTWEHTNDVINSFDIDGDKLKEVEDNSVKYSKYSENMDASINVTNVDNTSCSKIDGIVLAPPTSSSFGGMDDCDMTNSDSKEISATSTAMVVEPSSKVDESVLHSSMTRSIDRINGCDIMSSDSKEIIDTTVTMGMGPGSCLNVLLPSVMHLDSMTCETSNQLDLPSGTIISGIEKYGEESKEGTGNDLLTVSTTSLGYIDAYSNDIFTNTMEELEHVKMDTSIGELKGDIGSCRTLPDQGTLMDDTLPGELNASHISDANGHTGGLSNADSEFLSNMKVSVIEEMDKLGNVLESCFHSSNIESAEGDVIPNDEGNPLLGGSQTSWIDSSKSLSILDELQDQQCEDEISGANQKHEKISDYQDTMMYDTHPSQFIFLNEEVPGIASKLTTELGYVGELENANCLSMESGWGIPMSMDQCEMKAACAWCGREFDISPELQSDIVGSICQACKDSIPG